MKAIWTLKSQQNCGASQGVDVHWEYVGAKEILPFVKYIMIDNKFTNETW